MQIPDIAGNLKEIREKIAAASARRPPEYQYFQPCLVGASKIKSAEYVVAAYEAGLKHFGENYVNEMVEKASQPLVLEKCGGDIRWHFIGHLQRNKVNKVLATPNLYMIETIDSDKIATAVNNAWLKFRKDDKHLLKVMVQVNTSKEEEKNGCEVEEVSDLVKHVKENCENLEFVGLMTIGKYGYDPSNGPNPDFLRLKECRDKVCSDLSLDWKTMELSMGMSSDYEHAIELGSTFVRVGTAIFGERPKKVT